MQHSYFSEMLSVLAERAKLATLSQLRFANKPLRKHLDQLFDRPYGQPGSFLADPTFEAVFGWEGCGKTMSELAGTLLHPDLVESMDNPPKELVEDYRFPANRNPYAHQLKAWEILNQKEPQSLIVASGTGSGKTECFMVPILDSLVRSLESAGGTLIGTRALFLYPLNALINSQRERLRAWTDHFNGTIRYCLYNGNTPDTLPAGKAKDRPCEIQDRRTLRATPPPILVTNSTMLEFMLVRTADAPILQQSKGKLQWVVLDEAHSYIGSQAAEIALLVRRVLLAFGVTPEQVRFVATSATIGDPEGEAGAQLKQFLADISGTSVDRVHIVGGRRTVPNISGFDSRNSLSLDELIAIDPDQETSSRRYESLATHPTATAIRELFVGDSRSASVAKLSEVCRRIHTSATEKAAVDHNETALKWLDLLTVTKRHPAILGGDVEPFLPLRAHLFHQTFPGLWACCDQSCPEKANYPLSGTEWPFGMVYLSQREHCGCGSPVYDLVSCDECGDVFLLAGIDSEGCISHFRQPNAIDEFELDQDSDDEGQDESETDPEVKMPVLEQNRILIVNRELEGVEALFLDRTTRTQTERNEFALSLSAREDGPGGMNCPNCDGKEGWKRKLYWYSRIGAPYYLGSILPTLLEFAPDGKKPADHPCRGRRLLTFNDSRQGTARTAAKLQQGAERNRIRGLIYHHLLSLGESGDRETVEALRNEISMLEQANIGINKPELERLIVEKKARLILNDARKPVPFNTLSTAIAADGRDFGYMLSLYRGFSRSTFEGEPGKVNLAQMLLVREFGRRPKHSTNLETLGLVALAYPSLERINTVPIGVSASSDFGIDDWKDFLKISLDYFVRAGGTLEINSNVRQWLGFPFPQRYLVERDALEAAKNQRPWPRAKRSKTRNLLVRMLSNVLSADIATASGEDRIDTVLNDAWESLRQVGLLRLTTDGFILPLDQIAFRIVDKAWICPVTRRFLDCTLREVTPYLPESVKHTSPKCQNVDIPVYDRPFSDTSDDLERVAKGRKWLGENEQVAHLRENGLWTSFQDRTIELAPYFTAAEHSAQQDSNRLEIYEKEFKEGNLNLLSCSTTMEMGIDIGGISMVAMNNVPPHPANYLQRAGRAGRRNESRSTSMTLCKTNPHDQAIFANTKWAFDTALPAPRVSLNSTMIVRRHVQSYLLSKFLSERCKVTGHEPTKLTCGNFFVGDSPVANQFVAWSRSLDLERNKDIITGLLQVIMGSVFDGKDPRILLCLAADEMEVTSARWLGEWEQLEREEKEVLSKDDERSPASRAVTFHKKRLSEEYLLRELATRGFLPAYGFPTNITSFDNLTIERFKQIRESKNGREDNRFRRRELASRDTVSALREYAPGSDVVMDGLVFRSAGVTLNWHIPASQGDINEIQDIRFAWRCNQCGASQTSITFDGARRCSKCDSIIAPKNRREFLIPAGFTVDFYKEPSNDIDSQQFVPIEEPWIDNNGNWFPLDNPSLGRFRTTTRGHIFHQSRGLNRTGYALCLECGRAEPMTADNNLPLVFERPHYKLRGLNNDGRSCSGGSLPWKIKKGITLGHSSYTDMLELQLRSEDGAWLNDRSIALTLAIAIRNGLARLIGIETAELGCFTIPVRTEYGETCQSIHIFDRFAAGYSSTAELHLARIFKAAKQSLECDVDCPDACTHCVLDYDQRFNAELLNRKKALEFLNSKWLNGLQLPKDLKYFGESSRLEHRTLKESIIHSLVNNPVEFVRVFVGGDIDEWDIGPSTVRLLSYEIAGQECSLEVIIPDGTLESLDEGSLHLIASLADHPRVEIKAADHPIRVGNGVLAAEVKGKHSYRWAVPESNDIKFDASWGNADCVIYSVGDTIDDTFRPEISSGKIRPKSGLGDIEIDLQYDLDGPLRGFGARFWKRLLSNHKGLKEVFADPNNSVVSVEYSDRYLFTPIAASILAELLSSMADIKSGRFLVNIKTIASSQNSNHTKDRLWSDWPRTETRNAVLVGLLNTAGLRAEVVVKDRFTLGHSRTLTVNFENGRVLIIRFDQGVSYWKVKHLTPYRDTFFDVNDVDVDRQVDLLSARRVEVAGQQTPTQIFIKLR